MNDAMDLRCELAQHYGSETCYKHSLVRSVTYTEGVQCFARNAGGGAYWLLDILATEPAILRQAAAEFALVTLTAKDKSAKLVVTDGNDDTAPVYSRDIDYTDCPDGEWKFYFIGRMIMLPSEY